MTDEQRILAAIVDQPGYRWRVYAAVTGLPIRHAEDVIYDLWAAGKIQINPDSTLRLVRDGEEVFRHFAP
jgi:hypothetical protein